MLERTGARRRVGVAIVGLGGAIATTAVAGVELLRLGLVGTEGLPLADLPRDLTAGLVAYDDVVFGGWDLSSDNLLQAARTHRVLPPEQLEVAATALGRIVPWPAAGNVAFCRNIDGPNRLADGSHRAAVEQIGADLRRFRHEQGLDGLVMINLASTERTVDLSHPAYASLEAFEAALDAAAPEIGPAMLYAYAALAGGVPYANFTPSVAVDVPALVQLAERAGVPVAGKDGKTGQTLLKTAIAPALRARALRVDGWYSANILGNRDGLALDDAGSLDSKRTTKGSALDQILGYHVEDHLVDIRYYRPRGDNKESWDNVDVTGFLGQPMQLKVNFLCRDSILAAPLALELARLLDLAGRRGERGVQEQLGTFFKLPMTATPDRVPEHALHRQQQRLMDWLASASDRDASAVDEPAPAAALTAGAGVIPLSTSGRPAAGSGVLTTSAALGADARAGFATATATADAPALAPLLPLLAELNDLKRIRVAQRPTSIAERTFRRSWAALLAGEEPARVAARETAHAVAAARLAGIDLPVLARAGLQRDDAMAVLYRGFDGVAAPLGVARESLRRALADEPAADGSAVPTFVDQLIEQPRAGATRPGRPRLILEPPESHGDHCATVAVYAALLAPFYGAEPGVPFLAGLAHHLHNALLPDAGFAGEELLGSWLEPVVSALREDALRSLPSPLRRAIMDAVAITADADGAEARAFHAADVLDRVLQMRWYAQAADFTLDVALGDLDLVHPGPVQAFHYGVLRGAGLV